MTRLLREIILTTYLIIPLLFQAQNELQINGQALTADCFKIITIDTKLDTLNNKRVKVYHAEINNNCLEIGIIYGGCHANIELITDNQLIETQSLKLHFLLRYIEPTLCEALIKTKVKFDLLPFKNLRVGNYIIISLLGENYNLIYK